MINGVSILMSHTLNELYILEHDKTFVIVTKVLNNAVESLLIKLISNVIFSFGTRSFTSFDPFTLYLLSWILAVNRLSIILKRET